MVFSSHIFLFYFLPLVAGALLRSCRFARARRCIALASYVFYGWANPIWAVIMFFGSSVDYVCGLLLLELSGLPDDGALPPMLGPQVPRTRAMKRGARASRSSPTSALLAVFKYTGFVAENVNALGRALRRGARPRCRCCTWCCRSASRSTRSRR